MPCGRHAKAVLGILPATTETQRAYFCLPIVIEITPFLLPDDYNVNVSNDINNNDINNDVNNLFEYRININNQLIVYKV